jgi:hypothetical protein
MSNINFNPSLPPNDSLSHKEILAKSSEGREELKEKIAKAYQTAEVPVSTSWAAAEALATGKQAPTHKKAIKDAGLWHQAQRDSQGWEDDDYEG